MSLRSRDKSGHWETWPCHSSILAALSPVLRIALADHVVDEEVVIVSEVEGGALLNLLYTGSAQCSSRAVAGELWSAVAELGVEGAISLSKVLGEPQPAQRGPLMHIVLGVDAHIQDANCGETSAYINFRKESVVSPRPLAEEKRAEAEAETFLEINR